jgi:hypothetical protein
VLDGRDLRLRLVREGDLHALYDAHTDIANRGRYFPLGIVSESAFRREFADSGFWQADEGTLLMCTYEGELVGHIEFFTPVKYWDAFELSYQLYDEGSADAATQRRPYSFSSTTCSGRRRSTASIS